MKALVYKKKDHHFQPDIVNRAIVHCTIDGQRWQKQNKNVHLDCYNFALIFCFYCAMRQSLEELLTSYYPIRTT